TGALGDLTLLVVIGARVQLAARLPEVPGDHRAHHAGEDQPHRADGLFEVREVGVDGSDDEEEAHQPVEELGLDLHRVPPPVSSVLECFESSWWPLGPPDTVPRSPAGSVSGPPRSVCRTPLSGSADSIVATSA